MRSEGKRDGASRALRLLGVVCALCAALTVAACGGGGVNNASTQSAEGKPPATPSGTLRVALPGEPQSLDATRTVTAVDMPIMTALYDGLITRMPENFEELSPALATAWKSNSDATEWTFTLRRGVKFSDGADFNAAAAKKTLEFYLRPGTILSFALGPVSKITTPDEFTLVLSYEKPFPDLASYMPLVKMISPKLLAGSVKDAEKRIATQAAGTGPYILDSFSPSAGVVAHANPNYWGDGPHIEKIELRPIAEESARNAALQAGDIDLVPGGSPRSAQSFASDPRLKVSSLPSWTTEVLTLPTQQKPFDDVRVRRALAYAIDPEALAKEVMLGKATVTGSLMPPGTYGFHRPVTQYPYDPAKAKALLEEAGIRLPLSVTMASFTSTSATESLIGQAIVEQAKAGGFDIKYTQVTDTVGQADANKAQRKHQIYIWQNGRVNGGPLHLSGGFVTGAAHYTGKKLLDLVAQSNATANGPEREKILAEALEEAASEVVNIPLFTINVSDASVASLQKHVPPKDGFLPNWFEQYLTRK